MKTATVFGATGGMGNALVESLVKRGISVIAFARSEHVLLEKQKRWGIFSHPDGRRCNETGRCQESRLKS
jgi:NADP-dependent 3-hydroxy acid dehydrogenase YdfG